MRLLIRRLITTAVFMIAANFSQTVFSADLGAMLSDYVPGPETDSGWSVFAGKDFEMREGVAELEGRAFVRGNFTAAKYGYVIGRAGAGSGVFPPTDVPTLVVGGSIKGNGSINTPGYVPIQVASNIASTVSFIDRGTVITGGVDYATADALIADLHAKSLYWGSLPDTEGGSITSRWGGVYITADGENGNPKLWVFNLTFDVPSSYWGVQFSGFEDGDVILVNCKKTDSSDTFLLGVNSYPINGVNQNSPFAPKLLWNFPEAKTVTLSGYAAFPGSVLVGNPDSVTSVSVPSHDGRFATCGSLVHCGWSGCEFHNYPFTGTLPDLPLTISGTVRDDSDLNQAVSSPDQPVDGMTVELYTDPNGDGDFSDGVLYRTTQTQTDGSYAFTDLGSGSYVVVVVTTDLLGQTKNAALSVALTDGDSMDNDVLVEIDPSGFFYDVGDGRIVSGGRISVDGAGALIQLDGSSGKYMFVSTNASPAVFTIRITPPAGYVVDPSRSTVSSCFDPTGEADPVVFGSGEDSSNVGYLEDWTAEANPFCLVFELEPGDPVILNNNIPLVRLAALGGRVWEDLDGDGLRDDAVEPCVEGAAVRLLDATNGVVASATTDASGIYLFDSLLPASYRVSFTAPDGSLFTTANVSDDGYDLLDSDADPVSGMSAFVELTAGVTNTTVDAGVYVPAVVCGYLFVDSTADCVYGDGDAPIADALVRLVIDGTTVASTNSAADGYYQFAGVRPGTVCVRVARDSSQPVDVPTEEPQASDPMRNRAVASESESDAYVIASVVSGSGVIDDRTVDYLNFGFAQSSLSAEIGLRVFATGNGGVNIRLTTVDECGGDDIVIYAWLDNAWVEVGRVSADEVVGSGSNQYTVHSKLLSGDGPYYFLVVDESGTPHAIAEPVSVTSIKIKTMRVESGLVQFTLGTTPGCRYEVKTCDRLSSLADDWTNATVSVPKSNGWSKFSAKAFTAGTGTETQIRMQAGASSGFIKIVLVDD